MHVPERFLPEQHDGNGRIYHDTDRDDNTGIYGQMQYLRKAHNGYIYARVTKGLYGLPQAGRISNAALVKQLEPYGYHPLIKTVGLWTYKNRPISFTLVVHDFGVEYPGK